MSRLIINISDEVGEIEAARRVAQVMEQGRISKDGKQFCYMTRFMNGTCVAASITKKGTDTFTVWREEA